AAAHRVVGAGGTEQRGLDRTDVAGGARHQEPYEKGLGLPRADRRRIGVVPGAVAVVVAVHPRPRGQHVRTAQLARRVVEAGVPAGFDQRDHPVEVDVGVAAQIAGGDVRQQFLERLPGPAHGAVVEAVALDMTGPGGGRRPDLPGRAHRLVRRAGQTEAHAGDQRVPGAGDPGARRRGERVLGRCRFAPRPAVLLAHRAPASTLTACPVIPPDRSESRNSTCAAISSGRTRRRRMVLLTARFRYRSQVRSAGPWCLAMAAMNGSPYRSPSVAAGLSVSPGQTALTRTPKAPSSAASACVRPFSPNFDAQYEVLAGSPRFPAMEETITMLPSRRSIIPGTIARATRKAPSRLMSRVAIHWSSSWSHRNAWLRASPAQCTSRSTGPSRSSASRT